MVPTLPSSVDTRFCCSLFFSSSAPPSHLLSFPTRRSSDLGDVWLQPLQVAAQRLVGDVRPVPPEVFPSGSEPAPQVARLRDRKSTRLNSSHVAISYAVFCLKKKTLS